MVSVKGVIVSNTHGCFDDATEVGTAGFEDGFEVGECLFGLWDDASRNDFCGGGIDWYAAGNEDEVAGFDCLGIGTECGGGGWRQKAGLDTTGKCKCV